jgi:DNA-binding MarR family transcriptional regulator
MFSLDERRVEVHIHTDMTRDLDLNSMENCVCFNLRWVSRAFSHFFVSELNHHGLLPTQTPILGLLAAKPEASMAEVSDWLAMDRTTLVRNLRPLERDGLVKATGKGRGNKVSLSLTAKGRMALQKFLPDWELAQQKVIKTLGKERWTEILRDLERAALALN